MADVSDPTAGAKRPADATPPISASKRYTRMTPIDHVLQRPDTYIGSTSAQRAAMPVYVPPTEDGGMARVAVTELAEYVPGMFKVFDEILQNAADNVSRAKSIEGAEPTTQIKVTFNQTQTQNKKQTKKQTKKQDQDDPTDEPTDEPLVCDTISVWNNGMCIPVEMHETENMYVPELVFGELLTGDNFDDTQDRTTGGRNGYGAKLTNIYSTMFTVEINDAARGKHYVQTWRNNMREKTPAKITAAKTKSDWTRVTFCLDFARFTSTSTTKGLSQDMLSVMLRRVHDMAACVPGVTMYINNDKVQCHSLSQYMTKMLLPPNTQVAAESTGDKRWDVVVAGADEFQQTSFANAVSTTRGGTHVDHVVNKIVDHIMGSLTSKHPTIKRSDVKNAMCVGISCVVVNPTFDTQTKECLTLAASKFGSAFEPTDKFLKAVINKTDIVARVLTRLDARSQKDLARTSGTKKLHLTGIPKLDDANEAGGRQSAKCTLLLTEGDSAKALAVAGIGSIKGRDHYGVFPLRGKPLNVRDASATQVAENGELCSIVKILGLKHGEAYATPENRARLRYGCVVIMADQDLDGSHICGLIINMFHRFWPALLQAGFVRRFITPRYIVTTPKQRTLCYTDHDLDTAMAKSQSAHIKYLKGLGTSTPADAREYFGNINKHIIPFTWDGDDAPFLLAFDKTQADARKTWVAGVTVNTEPKYNSQQGMSCADFVNKELVLFSAHDNMRSIPALMDGLKPGQRKCLYAAFKRNLTKGETKIAQLCGYIAEHTAYHHGEVSLADTLVGMAQDYVGSNNINLFLPLGQFGTRIQGGKDKASARYIFTRLADATRCIFPEADDSVLTYRMEEAERVEPTWYVPIIPMVLVNGADGIGTGWSTSVPQFAPLALVDIIEAKLNNKSYELPLPWYRGFKGRFEATATGYVCHGNHSVVDSKLTITELPVGVWTQPFKELLEKLVVENKIAGYRENHTDTDVNFAVELCAPSEVPVEITRRLAVPVSMRNMVLFDTDGHIRKFETLTEIIDMYYTLRLKMYGLRKEHQLADLRVRRASAADRERFICLVLSGTLVLTGKPQKDIEADVEAHNLSPSLLALPLTSLSLDRATKLRTDREQIDADIAALECMTPADLWLRDLAELRKHL